MTSKNFAKKAILELLEDNFSVFLLQTEEESGTGGWIDVDNRQITATVGGWGGIDVSILLHEYSHYLQWKTKRRFYNKKMNSCEIFFGWLEGTTHKDSVVDKSLNEVIELELDCENIAVNLIKNHKIDIDVKKYIQKANASILFYHISRETRKWCEYSPYDTPIMKSMPEDLQSLEYYLDKNNIKEHQRKKYLEIIAK